MSSDFKELQRRWESSKKGIEQQQHSFENLYKKIRIKEKENYFFYYGTITILLLVLIVISLFFYYIAPVEETLSRIGAGLMISGLLFRIIIEIISIYKAKQINSLDNTLKTTQNTINFYQFRKTIHRIIAPIIVVLYTLGFYTITPEFILYLEFWHVLLMDISYLFIGIILFVIIRKSVKKEMQKLIEIVKLKNEIIE